MKTTLLLLLSLTQVYASETLFFTDLDIREVHQKEIARERKGEAPHFAVRRDVSVSPKSSMSNWQAEGDNWVWSQRVQAVNAVSLNFAFESFHLPVGAKLEIASTDLTQTMRPFTAQDNNAQRELWTPVILSDDVTIKLTVPADRMNELDFALTKVNQGFRTFGQSTEKAGSCNVDVACSEGDDWRNEINSVAVIGVGGRTFCTGFMVNNTRGDKDPLFMTAHHCGISSSRAASLVVYWNYQRSRCNGRNDARLDQFQTGAKLLASSSTSDFTIVRLNSEPRADWNVNYAGWDRSGREAITAVAIHHPNTDEKSISFEYDGTSTTSYLRDSVPGNGTHVKVADWDVGTTEPGSSGSPLFDENRRVIGQLHGGYASCTSQTADWYGRISYSWEGEGSESTRLKDHLDADNTGAETVDTI